MNRNYEYVSWEDVGAFIESIADMYEDLDVTFSGEYGLPRGGLVFAVMLSHRLDIPLLNAPAKGCLIVDDICDSGESILHFIKNSSNPSCVGDYEVATMYYNRNAIAAPTTHFKEKNPETWIVFPWEKRPE